MSFELNHSGRFALDPDISPAESNANDDEEEYGIMDEEDNGRIGGDRNLKLGEQRRQRPEHRRH